jgi:hypothetical protein
MAQKKCLLIIPRSFYSFHTYIERTLNADGYDVEIANEEYPENTIGKLMGKLNLGLLLTITRNTILEKFVGNKKYDLILIIKGRGMGSRLIDELKKCSPLVVGYNFDSFKYHKAPLNWFKHVNKYYTFDYRDGEQYNIPIVELFSSIPEEEHTKEIEYTASAILRNHSKRLKFVDEVLRTLDTDKVFIHIYEQNIFTFCINFFNNPRLYLKFRKHISYKSLPYKKYTEVLKKSDFTIDYAHPKQSGITMRCFEALSTQTKIISNNEYLRRNSNFTDSNTIIYSGDDSLLKQRSEQISGSIPNKVHRSISDFIEDLIQ